MIMRHVLTILLLLFLLATPAIAQVTFDAASSSSVTGAGSLTFSHTTSGSDRLLIVGTMTQNADVSGVTYNSVSMTLIDTVDTGAGYWGNMYALVAPATGANDIVISMGADGCSGACTNIAAGAVSLNAVNQATPLGTSVTGNDPESTPVNITVPANGMAVDVVGDTGSATINPTDEQTERWDVANGDSSIHSLGATTDTSGSLPWASFAGYKIQIAVPVNTVTATTGRRRPMIAQ